MQEAKIVTNDMQKDILTVLPPENDPPMQDKKQPKQLTIHDPIYTPSDIENVYHSEQFNVNQLLQRGRDGMLLYSTFFIRLYGGQQAFHLMSGNLQIKYTITHGKGWVHIDGHGYIFDTLEEIEENGKRFSVDRPRFVLVEKNQDCQILNNDPKDYVDFDFVFPGKLDIRRVIEEDKRRRH